jgi:hypothetical protein
VAATEGEGKAAPAVQERAVKAVAEVPQGPAERLQACLPKVGVSRGRVGPHVGVGDRLEGHKLRGQCL